MARLASVAAFGFPDLDTPALLGLFGRLGCVNSQFYRNPQNPPDADEARRMADDLGLPFDSLHGWFGDRFDPSSTDEATRLASIEAYRAEGELAARLDARRVVVHPAPAAAKGSPPTEASRAERIGPLTKSLEDLARIGEGLGVVYLIENIPAGYRFGSDPAQLAGMVRALNHPSVRMCFDTGHAHMTGGADTALRDCLDVIGYVHINDNDGRDDAHLIPGEGTVPWAAMQPSFASLPGDTAVMLELFTPQPQLLAAIESGLAERLADWLATR